MSILEKKPESQERIGSNYIFQPLLVRTPPNLQTDKASKIALPGHSWSGKTRQTSYGFGWFCRWRFCTIA